MKLRSALKGVLIVAAGVVVLGAAALAWVTFAPRRVPEGQPPLSTLDAGSLPDFRKEFNAGEGRARLLVLLSPT